MSIIQYKFSSVCVCVCVCVKVAQSCPSLCDPMDYTVMEFSTPEYWSG